MRTDDEGNKCYTPTETTQIFKKRVDDEAAKLKEYLKETNKDLADYV